MKANNRTATSTKVSKVAEGTMSKRKPLKCPKDSGSIVAKKVLKTAVNGLPTGSVHKSPFYCRVTALSNIAQPLSDIIAANKPKSRSRLFSNRMPEKKWIPTTTTTTFKDDYRTSELIQKLLPMHVVPVLTKAKKLYNTKRLFYITLNTGLNSKRCAPHDFQRMFTAAERYMSASLRRKIQEIHMENLLPPPAQFADPKDDKKLWKWRMERKKTVTLYHISK